MKLAEKIYYIISGIIIVVCIFLIVYWQNESARIQREVNAETLEVLIEVLDYMGNRK